MQRRNRSRVSPDEEGFPASPLGSSFPSLPSRDGESGEILGDKVVALRRAPEESPRRLRLRPGVPRERNQPGHYSLLKQHQQFSGFRIRDALAQQGGLRLRKGSMTYSRRPVPMLQPEYQMCVQMEGGVPVRQTAFPKVPRQWHEEWDQVRFRPPFRVPRESLPGSQRALPSRKRDRVHVSIWEEFLLGTKVFKKNGKCIINEQNMIISSIKQFLRRFLSRKISDVVMIFIYFLSVVLPCVTYNNYLEFIGYILLHGHLKLHESAYSNNIDLDFTGSVFQGPGYICVRSWCKHCTLKDDIKVFNSLMKKMKADILTAKGA
ncbi:uncharacterized protein LOC125047205 [Penaeus chinensis]|uniref:uncharacterized protein LOC125047205 n=1 Tax=Penaeus chinensis TaxID=139456 RepID=UPI001FB75CD5|nr:uncharacterized protein LOC125047205 [Penaeus chinensis]XP_047501313.1 uncharacterized protein LOC125047205 [Penaeus chinensis]XP_047501314.1 uncharacterized protein LOC125047205 [Penaeus chinensis]